MPPSPLTILLHTKHHIVCNKPPFVYSQPPINKSFYTNTVQYLASKLLANSTFYPVHRLDFNVSGCICLALSKSAAQQFQRNLRVEGISHKGYVIERVYLGRIRGREVPIEGKVDTDIDGKPSVTHYMIIGAGADGVKTVLFKLDSGRKHQIRRHMASIGNPIVGDVKYGDSVVHEDAKSREFNSPIALHSFYLHTQIGMKNYDTFAPLMWNYGGMWDGIEDLEVLKELARRMLEKRAVGNI